MRGLSQPPWLISAHGAKVTIAVLDSGLSLKHPALHKVVVHESRSFTGQDPLSDPVGHGTECCSILVAQPGHGGPGGVVRDIRLIIGQVIESDGTGKVETLCDALRWVANLDVDVVVVPSGRLFDHWELRRAVGLVNVSGAVMVAPVGNPHNGQKGPLFPAAYSQVIGVGSEVYLDTYLNWSQPPDVVVSMDEVRTCTPDGGWRTAVETSQATMFVAGFACLFRAGQEGNGKSRASHESLLSCIESAAARYKSNIGG